VGTLVTEIKTKSNPKKEWSCNLHMGTHPTQLSDQRGWGGEKSDYKNEMDWMRRPVEEWPIQKMVNPPPMEECWLF
jgi:hypothetical protein